MGEVGGVARRPAAAGLNPPVVLPDRVRIVVGAVGEIRGPFQRERVLHAVVEALVVGPHAQYVVGFLLPDLARNRLLTAHGIQGHAALQAQHAQQFRDGRDFVGVVVHRRLGQHQAVGLDPGAHQMQGPPIPDPGRGSRAHSCRQWARPGRRSGQRRPAPSPENPPRSGPHPAARRPGPAYRARGSRGAVPEKCAASPQHQDVRQGVPLGAVDPRILQAVQGLDQGRGHRAVHEGLLRRLDPEPPMVATPQLARCSPNLDAIALPPSRGGLGFRRCLLC